MSEINLENWVAQEETPSRQSFRQAVHLILRGIAQSSELSPIMVMKGGILLAIRYQSHRFTTDIDFSTPRRLQEVDLESLLASIEGAIVPVDADNEYGLAIRLQSYEIKPPNRPGVSFPTLQLRIGYAQRNNRGQMRRLAAGQVTDVVQIDYSFNEWASSVEYRSLDGGQLSLYGFYDLIAEKIRSVLQQPIRKRARYQDIYDLFLLLEAEALPLEAKHEILNKLRDASAERGISLHQHAMRDQAIIDWSRRDYGQLIILLDVTPPDFEVAYELVREFYESLPWQ